MAVNEQLVLTGVRFFGVLQEALDWLVRGRAFVNCFVPQCLQAGL